MVGQAGWEVSAAGGAGYGSESGAGRVSGGVGDASEFLSSSGGSRSMEMEVINHYNF